MVLGRVSLPRERSISLATGTAYHLMRTARHIQRGESTFGGWDYPSKMRHDDADGRRNISKGRHGTWKGVMVSRKCDTMSDGVVIEIIYVFSILLL